MMKKVISLFLAAALCASLTGCGLGAKQAAKNNAVRPITEKNTDKDR